MSDTLEVGLDVSAKTFDTCFQLPGKAVPLSHRFENTPEGRLSFLRNVKEYSSCSGRARICFESTGTYSLDLALLLYQTEGVEVMVVNPHQMSQFRGAMAQRNKSDRTDAELALTFVQRMDFQPWQAPSRERRLLRQLGRRIADLIKLQTQEKNRRHAAQADEEASILVLEDLEEGIAQIATRIERLRSEAVKVMEGSAELKRYYELILTVTGIGEASAISILSELLVLPADLKVKQWVAWAGLDPVIFESGTSVCKAPRLSRRGSTHLRAGLFMPARTAAIHDPHVRSFYGELKSRGKKPLQIYAAIMRKLLHAIFGMFKHDQPFDGAKFRRLAA